MGLPAHLYAVRHGQSTANLAMEIAARDGSLDTRLRERDPDIPLTDLGRRQSGDVGRWLAGLPPGRTPDVVVSSSYLRARQTAQVALRAGGLSIPVEVDARFRDREQGDLELLTHAAVRELFPREEARRRAEGEFDYRPPGGESLWDVTDRVRDAYADVCARCAGGRVLIVAHDAVILALRAVIQALSADDLGKVPPVRNAAVCHWQAYDGRLRLRAYDDTDHLAAPTSHPVNSPQTPRRRADS